MPDLLSQHGLTNAPVAERAKGYTATLQNLVKSFPRTVEAVTTKGNRIHNHSLEWNIHQKHK